jgi:hypothetical protein
MHVDNFKPTPVDTDGISLGNRLESEDEKLIIECSNSINKTISNANEVTRMNYQMPMNDEQLNNYYCYYPQNFGYPNKSEPFIPYNNSFMPISPQKSSGKTPLNLHSNQYNNVYNTNSNLYNSNAISAISNGSPANVANNVGF